MKYLNYILLLLGVSFLASCTKEQGEASKIARIQEFGFIGLPDKVEVQEVDSVYVWPFTFDDKQIFDFKVNITVGDNSTATEDKDFALGSHSISVPTLAKKGEILFEVGADVFLEGDEKVFLTLSSDYPGGVPLSKTIEITIKNVGGCPEYVHNNFVGDYEVVSDGWADWTPGTTLKLANVSKNVLSFKYNCGDSAKAILLTIDPETFGISGTKKQYCSYDLPPITKFFGDIIEASSSVNTCEKTLSVNIAHTDEANKSYGNGAIVLKKK
jgi:hypothetical protein